MSPRLAFSLLLVAFCLLAAPARAAAPIDSAGAAQLKSVLEKAIADRAAQERPGGAKLQFDGDVMVEEAGSYYAITLPHAGILYPDGGKLDIGMISINASPHDTPGEWKMAVAIPTPITLFDPQKKQLIKINIGAQKASGIWDEQFGSFPKLDAEFKNVTLENAAAGFLAQIPVIQILYDFDKDPATGFWSGPGRITLKDIAAQFAGATSIKLAAAEADFVIQKYDPSVLADYRTFLKTFLEDMAKKKQSGTPADPAMTDQLAGKLTGLLLNSSDGMKCDYAFTGLAVTRPDPLTHQSQTLSIDSGSVGLTADGLRNPKAALAVHAAFDGLAVNPPRPGIEGIMPTATKINIGIHDIPSQQVADMAMRALRDAARPPDVIGRMLPVQALGALSQAGTTLELKDSAIRGRDYSFEINGVAQGNPQALFTFTAALQGTFTGLDELQNNLKAVDPKSPESQNAQNLSHQLDMLRAYGKADKGPDGKTRYTYDLKLTPEGQILMNGAPAGLGFLPAMPLSAAPTAPPPAPAPAPK